MSKNVKLNNTNYSGVSTVQIPTTDGGTAEFKDVDEITVPTGTKTITANGTHDVRAYAQAVVNVPTGDGDASGGGTGSSGVYTEIFNTTITEAKNDHIITFDPAWDDYSVLILVLEGITLSASDFLRAQFNARAISGAGFYPPASSKVTEFSGEHILLLKYNGTWHRVTDANSNAIESIEPAELHIFATTQTVNVTAGTIKILGMM